MANGENFVFAFNDFAFSDRLLRLEIVPDDESLKGFSSIHATHSKDSETCLDAKVVTLHISSPILASKSPFFFKLFKNGMRESQHKNDVSFKINASEERAFMDLLNFIYGSSLRGISASDLIGVLIAADKFEVVSCMRHCVEVLLGLPMSESAVCCLELPESVSGSEIVKPLIDEAKKYIAALYRDFTKSQEELMELPLSALEVALGSEGLQAISEDHVFDFILKWARASYPELEERREILTTRLGQFICFANLSCSKLKEALECPDFDHEQVSKLVLKAFFSKVEISCGQHVHPSKDLATTDCGFSGRVYTPRCVVYFDIEKKEIKTLSPFYLIRSQQFSLGGRRLYLGAEVLDQRHLGLYVHCVPGSEGCTLDFEFAVMHKSSKEFKSMCKFNGAKATRPDRGWGTRNLLRAERKEFMRDDSDYFINDVLHIRAELTLVSLEV